MRGLLGRPAGGQRQGGVVEEPEVEIEEEETDDEDDVMILVEGGSGAGGGGSGADETQGPETQQLGDV